MTGATDAFAWYAAPQTGTVPLSLQPRPASWDARDSAAQVRLSRFLTNAEDDLREQRETAQPWSIELTVGLPTGVSLLDHHDLDNYLAPLVSRLGAASFMAARARKRHSEQSWARLSTARPSSPPAALRWYRVHTEHSPEKPAYKQSIHEQLTAAGARPPASGEALALTIAIRCSPRRNWVNLWKPTIDAVGPLIGEGRRAWSPRDGAIVDLALHLTTDQASGWSVDLLFAAARSGPRATTNIDVTQEEQ